MRRGQIDSIQMMRGIAATAVAAFHLGAAAPSDSFFRVFEHGEAGVDLFFVISGFIILYSVEARPGMTRDFFVRARFWRILPPYWAILTCYVLAASLLGLIETGEITFPSWSKLGVSYFVLPYPDHVIIIAWTLSIELLFYAVFALVYFRYHTKGLVLAMIAWYAATQLPRIGSEPLPTWLLLPLHSIVLEFLFGTLIAMVYMRGRMPLQWTALLVGSISMFAYLGGWIQMEVGREIMPGIPAALIIYGVLKLRVSMPRIVLLWGESSYILYLGHLLAFSVMGNLALLAVGVDVYASDTALIVMLVSAIALSCLATRYIEQPYQRWYKRTRLSKLAESSERSPENRPAETT